MTKNFSLLTLVTLFVFWSCAASTEKNLAHSFDIDDLLTQLPAENVIKHDLLMQAFLTLGEDKLVSASRHLDAQASDLSVQAEYAFHGLALYVNGVQYKKQRTKYLSVIDQAVKTDLSFKSRVFLLEQLQYIVDPQAVTIAAAYLSHAELWETSVMVLQSQETQRAVTALTDALTNANDSQKVAIVQALEKLNATDAAAQIYKILPADDELLQISALTALAAFAYQPAEPQILDFAKKQEGKPGLSLLYAQSLLQDGEKGKSESIFREIFYDDAAMFNSAQRCAALRGLSLCIRDNVFADLLKAFNDDDKVIRITALDIARSFAVEQNIRTWLNTAASKSVEQQIEIIDFLANIKNTSAIPWLKEKLNEENPAIQVSSLAALLKIQSNTFDQDLQAVLQSDMADTLSHETESILMQWQDSLALRKVVNAYDSYSLSGKKVILKIIAQRRLLADAALLLNALNSQNTELQIVALDGLALLELQDDFAKIIKAYLKTEDNEFQQQYEKAVMASYNAKTHTDYLLELFDNASQKDKIKLLKIFRQAGGQKLFEKSQQFLSNAPDASAGHAKDILVKWKDENALPFLIHIAQNDKDKNSRIQALRSSAIILKDSSLPVDEIIAYCEILLQANPAVSEKRVIISIIAQHKNNSAMELLVKELDDPDIGFNSYLALLSWAETKSADENLRFESLITKLLQGKIPDSLRLQIEQYRMEKFSASPPEGFTALFNGLDLSGWKGLVADPVKRAQMTPQELQSAQQKADSIMRACWSVSNGMLIFNGQGFPNICTQKDYQDFELYVDWKIEEDGDSGIYLRGSPQIQIWEPAFNSVGSGGLFNNKKNSSVPLHTADKPVGEWNTFHIIMKGQRVTVFLNSTLVVNNVILENYWERDKAIYSRGPIELQAHRHPLYFKNIYIKELAAEPELYSGALFNGKDLSGWTVINNQPDSWQVADGMLLCQGQGGGWLSTEKEYDNFELQLEFRMPEGGNSGVFIRSPHQGDPAYSGMEIQLLDDYSVKYKNLKDWQYTGSLYDLQAPAKRVTRKSGEWQKITITCQGPDIRVVLNDEPIIDANLADFGHAAKKHPGIKNRKGFIGLQNHGARVEFRNIILTELP